MNTYVNLSTKEKREMEKAISTEYCVDPKVVKTILKDFVSVEDFLMATKTGDLTAKQEKFAEKTVVKFLDNDLGENAKNFNMLMCAVFGDRFSRTGEQYSFSSEVVKELLEDLTPREKRVIEMRYGLNTGVNATYIEIAKEFEITSKRASQIESKSLRKLRHPSRSIKLKDNDIYSTGCKEYFTDEEQIKCDELEHALLNSPLSFERASYRSIDSDRLIELDSQIKNLSALKQNVAKRVVVKPVESKKETIFTLQTPIDELDLSVRAYNCLKRAGINLIGELKALSKEELSLIRNIGQNAVVEICHTLNSLELVDDNSNLVVEKIESLEEIKEPSLTELIQKRSELISVISEATNKLTVLEDAIENLSRKVSIDNEINSERK